MRLVNTVLGFSFSWVEGRPGRKAGRGAGNEANVYCQSRHQTPNTTKVLFVD